MTPEEIITRLNERFPEHGLECRVDKGHAVVDISLDRMSELLKALKDEADFGFNMLMDVTAVDWLERDMRFDIVYHLYSVEHNHRLRIKVMVADGQSVPSSVKLWTIADWMEREIWDMYGIRFDGHPNLKRLLLYEEFKGHPLRKDYPYDKRQPLIPDTWPVRDEQQKMDDLGIHRP